MQKKKDEPEQRLKNHKAEYYRLRGCLQGIAELFTALSQFEQREDLLQPHNADTGEEHAIDEVLPVLQQYWSGRCGELELEPEAPLPFEEGQSLGHCFNGPVFSVHWMGIDVAHKRVYRPKPLKKAQTEGIELLKNLCHYHIVKLVGSYYQKSNLGLLIWLAATCDLAWFLEAWNSYKINTFSIKLNRYFHFDANNAKVKNDSHIPEQGVDAIGGNWLSNFFVCLILAFTHLH